ncbi:putative bifunctional diguanylate cyclase/phosphodiesterase [Blastococcus sp. SYSU D00669]
MSSDPRRGGAPERVSRRLVLLTVGCLALFVTGTGPRPDGATWALLYDVVLYNAVHVLAALVCFTAAVRLPGDRLTWVAMGTGLVMSTAGNLVHSLVIARLPEEPYPSVADVAYLASFVPTCVGLVAFVRARTRRFGPATALDGLVGALGASAVAVAVLLGPQTWIAEGDPAAVVVSLAYPVADMVLLALFAAAGAVLGLRGEVPLLLLLAGVALNLTGDLVFARLATLDIYVEGGPLDLTWLVSAVLIGLAAHRARPAHGDGHAGGSTAVRTGWRHIAIPLALNAASLAVLVRSSLEEAPFATGCAAVCIAVSFVRSVVTFGDLRDLHAVRAEARTDELTGLPNRRALLASADAVVAAATARRPAALLLLDLDGFKEVNDGLGHAAGDDLLRRVGPRLAEELGPQDLLARLGGDEFAVLLPDADVDRAQELARRLHARLREPFTVEGVRLHVGVSIGVATAPVPAATVHDLLRCADVAMYAAKAARDGVRVHVPDPSTGLGDRLRTMEELRTALDRDEILVHLQPQVRLADGAVVGVEALVRWQHPTRGLLSPAELLPAAEQAGLLRPLTDVVVDLALRAAATWWRARQVPVSVNLSASDVGDRDLPDRIAAALARHGLPGRALTVELVEDTLMADPERGRLVLGELRHLGVRTAIDDYGTGYSSLAYLRYLPADELKPDRSLTADVDRDLHAAAIVRHTAALAHDLGLRLVAEGVEDDAIGQVLARLGCDTAQGYGIARPMPPADLPGWLAARRSALLDEAPA